MNEAAEEPAGPDPALELRRGRAWATVLVAVGLLVSALLFGPQALGAGYVHDDHPTLVDNPLARWPPDVAAIWTHPWFGTAPGFRTQGLSRPLVTMSFAVEDGLSLNAAGRHALNLGLFGLVAGLVGALLWLLLAGRPEPQRRAASLAATLLFATHPVHTSAVMGLAYRPELMGATLALLASGAFVLAVRRGGRVAMAATPLLLLLALWSKESGITVLGAWLVWGLCQHARGRALALWLGSAALVGGWLAWRSTWLEGPWVAAHDNPLGPVTAGARLFGALWLVAHAAEKLAWPLDLAPDETFDALPVLDPPLPGLLVGGALLLGLLVAALRWWRLGLGGEREAALKAAGVAWFGGGWLPVSHLLFPSTVLFADRLLFLPSVALAMALGALLAPALVAPAGTLARRVGVGLLIAVTVPWGVLAHAEAGHWRSELALFEHSVERRPRSLRMRYNLGRLLLDGGDAEASRPHLREALLLDPAHSGAFTLLMQAHTRLGDCEGVAALRRPPKALRSDGERKAQLDAGVRCGRFGEAFAAGLALRKVDAEWAKKVYVAGVAAGDKRALAWARRFVRDPERAPPWVAAAVYAEQQAKRPAAALGRLERLHRARPGFRPALAMAAQLCRRTPALRERCQRWPGTALRRPPGGRASTKPSVPAPSAPTASAQPPSAPPAATPTSPAR